VGDFVLLQYEPNGDSLIVKTLPRKSLFSRSDFSGHAVGYVKTIIEQTVAANFVYVFIMASLNNDFNVSRIERYLAAAWQSGATPVVLLTKSDLAPEPSEQISAAQAAAPDVEEVLSRPCKFSDCHHVTEPGCAVKAAIQSGELPLERWEHYNYLKREAKFTEDKSGFLREKSARNKSLAMWSKESKKNGGNKK
jgi:putative ribosome biogenesis GTPase RsgA